MLRPYKGIGERRQAIRKKKKGELCEPQFALQIRIADRKPFARDILVLRCDSVARTKRSRLGSLSSFKPSVLALAPRENIHDKNAHHSSRNRACEEGPYGPSPEKTIPGQPTPTPRHNRKDRQQHKETTAKFQLAQPIPSTKPCMSLRWRR